MNRIIKLLPWLVLLPLHVLAADFTVDNTAIDAVDDNPGDGICHIAGVAPGEPACTLRAAVMEANQLAGDDRIILPFGAHTVLSLAGRDEGNAATGDLDILYNTTITTPTVPTRLADYASIDANGIDRVLDINSVESGTHLVGLIIAGGLANTATGNTGGGIMNRAPDLLIEDSIIMGNQANAGAGIRTLGSLTLRRTRIHDNSTLALGFTNPSGCAIFDRDSSPPAGTHIQISNSTIDHNTCAVPGSAIQLVTSIQIDNSTISENTARAALNMYNNNATLNHVTIIGSDSGYSIGSHDGSVISTVRNSIIVGQNFARACNINNAVVDHAWTLADDSSCQLTVGSGNLADTEPMLGPLATRYSMLPVQQPAVGSPAIDAGDPANSGSCLAEDEDGLPRPIDGDGDGTARCDIGAIEMDDSIFSDGFE